MTVLEVFITLRINVKKKFIIIDIKYINNSQIVLFADMTNGIFLFIHMYCLISINDKN